MATRTLHGGTSSRSCNLLDQQTAGSRRIHRVADRSRPAVQSHEGATEIFQIEEQLAQALVRLAESRGATLFMILLAAFQTLIWRYTSSEDILVGTPIGARGDVNLEKLIGFFVNTLVIRGDLSGNPSFVELLRRTREATIEAYEH